MLKLEPFLSTILFLCLIGCVSCGGPEESGQTRSSSEPQGTPWLQDQARAAGLDFKHHTGAKGEFLFPEHMGGGVALLDFDGDGYLDIFLLQSGDLASPGAMETAHRLYRNRGDGTFEDVSAGSGLLTSGYGIGVVAGDYDGDGRTDLYLLNVGGNVLLRNLGAGEFEDVTERAGVAGMVWSTSGCFSDYDADGDLDLFVANYVFWTKNTDKECYEQTGRRTYCGPHSYNAPVPDVLYRNDGDGTFSEVSREAGLSNHYGNGLGVVSVDFNGDGFLDFFVANDRSEDQLWMNKGDGTFQDEANLMGCAVDRNGVARAGMGVDAADVDDDGDPDLIVVNLHGELDGFYRNEGHYFFEQTTSAGIGLTTRAYTRFGVGFEDFDNDQDLDLYQANGRVTLVGENYVENPFAEPNVLLIQNEPGKWRESDLLGGTEESLIHVSRGAAFGDFDNDGGVDVVVVNSNEAPYLLRNVHADRGHWLLLDVRGRHGSSAIGASVHVVLGERKIRRDVLPGRGYASSSDPRVHLGLGAVAELRELEVRWVDGQSELFGPFTADQVVILRRGEGRPPH
ncbi:MAG: hypothetical protein ACI8X5_000705 [Planctomycetota bacterium]|jgi:hypothetical protein